MNGGVGGRPPTRFNLVRARRRLERVRRGRDLLERKRRALVGELFRAARPAADARSRIAEQAERAYPALLAAHADRPDSELEALGWPTREVRVRLRPVEIWGVSAAEIADRDDLTRPPQDRGTSSPSAGLAADAAAAEFESLAALLLDAASREILLRSLARALRRTTRQLNTLERRVLPDLEEEIRDIERVLEEREREEHVRVRRLLRRRGRGASSGPSPPSSGRGEGTGINVL